MTPHDETQVGDRCVQKSAVRALGSRVVRAPFSYMIGTLAHKIWAKWLGAGYAAAEVPVIKQVTPA